MENVIEVANLSRRFKTFKSQHGEGVFLASLRRKYFYKKAVSGVSFSIKQGELIALLGENGSGKSTLIKIMTGILHGDSGTARVLGMDPWRYREELDLQIGVVFGKQSNLFWNLPAIDTFEFIKKLYGIPQREYEERMSYYVDTLGLEEVYKRPVRTMSLGERMKCNFVSAVLHNPKVVFLDEPTIGVDLPSGIELRRALLAMRSRYNTTVLLATHVVDDIEALGERVLMMDKGRLLFDGPQHELRKIFGNKKQIEVYFKNGNAPGIDRSWRVLERRDGYLKLEVEPRHLKGRMVTALLQDEAVIDYNVSSPDLSYVLERVYLVDKRRRRRGRGVHA